MSVNRNVPIVYTILADMKRDSSLKVGMTAMTLGYNSVNDGLGATYYIMDNYNDAADDINIVLDDPSKKAVALGNSNYQKELNEIKNNIIANADAISLLSTSTAKNLQDAINPLNESINLINQKITTGFDEINNNAVTKTLRIHPIGLNFGLFGNGLKYILSTGKTDIPEAGVDGIIDLPITGDVTFAHYISELSTGDFVRLPIGKNTETLEFTTSLNVYGANADLEADIGKSEIDLETDTVLSGTITIKSGINLTLYGIILTGDAHIVLEEGASVNLVLCSFINVNGYIAAEGSTSAFIQTTKGISSTGYANITRCYFGAPVITDTTPMTNVIKLLDTISMSSQINANVFVPDCCADVPVLIMAPPTGSSMSVSSNKFGTVFPGIKVMIDGSPDGSIIFDSNTYETTSTETYPTLLLIKPNAELTTTYAGMTFVISNTIHTDELPVYILASEEGDLVFTDTNKPTIIVDNETVVSPVIPETLGDEDITPTDDEGGTV